MCRECSCASRGPLTILATLGPRRRNYLNFYQAYGREGQTLSPLQLAVRRPAPMRRPARSRANNARHTWITITGATAAAAARWLREQRQSRLAMTTLRKHWQHSQRRRQAMLLACVGALPGLVRRG